MSLSIPNQYLQRKFCKGKFPTNIQINKIHAGTSESFGLQQYEVNDVIGCFIEVAEQSISKNIVEIVTSTSSQKNANIDIMCPLTYEVMLRILEFYV